MVHYAESAECRRVELLAYFGEDWSANSPHPATGHPHPIGWGAGRGEGHPGCGGCDNCLAPRETFDGTVAAQKFLSCVYRIRQHSHFGVGLNHVVEVLTGADTEKVRKWGHTQLSTYNIGQEHNRKEWQAIGRELMRLGLLSQTNEKFSTLELTNEGLAVLKQRKSVTLTRPMKVPLKAAHQAGEIACDEMLFDRLRGLRKHLADERGVPPYIVFSDVALRQMARFYPANEVEFARISGVGAQKLKEFSAAFLAEIANHLAANPRQMFADDSFTAAPPPKPALSDTVRESLRRFRAGETVGEIARAREIVTGTVHGHLATAIEAGEAVPLKALLNEDDWECITDALRSHTGASITPVHSMLGGRYDFGLLRVVRAAMNRGQKFE
jgi:ATP-dependent DNA helicase RecQ